MTNKCSRAGCTNQATFLIYWRNPKLHSPEREKIWGACLEHKSFLIDYLSARSFFLRTEAINNEND
ncbi:MAG: acetone carboxylase [Actinobacteria bacterium]|nr:acetone carboxylase [Actinomycetota bacterium]